jgi:hypothetical protein
MNIDEEDPNMTDEEYERYLREVREEEALMRWEREHEEGTDHE